ncbi:hypothetical protein COHA_010039 [Chlorella ohadii]|uniref:Uncharacterized protein n=1 Tax=Chlorella ohadii TaxID=2649997 RepID=A0AAD5DIF8_9CHLO|nr:hypothetical protein COHA_010039 [Chlorella ohadii]
MATEAAEAAPAAAQPTGAAPLKKLVLRLDDGTLIKAAGGEGGDAKAAAVVLRPGDAYTGGKLTEAHLLKAQVLLCEAHAKLPDEGPLRSLSLGSKRSTDTGFEVGPVGSKRSRSLGGALANGADEFHMESPTSASLPAPPQPAYVPPPQPAYRVLNNVLNNLGPNKVIFYEPVNPAQVTDYYTIVKKPICLKDIQNKLERNQYATPTEMYLDMDQLVYNCMLYNPAGTFVRELGSKVEQRWLDNWRRSPVLAPYAVPHQRLPKPKAQAQKKSAAAARPQRSSGGQPRRAPPKAQAAPRVPRTTSVNSYKNYQALPAEQQAQLAEALQDENVLASKMDGVVAILQKANQLPTNEEGEVELDLSVLSPGVVWELYEYVIGRPPVAAQPARSSFQLQEDSDYDPYGEEEED